MENITLGQIATILAFIVGLLGSVKYLSKELKNQVNKTLEPVNNNIKELDVSINKRINELDVSQCKNFLVRFLADVEQGNELDEVERKRAYEVYDHYTNDLKQNSYIHKRWEELMEVKK